MTQPGADLQAPRPVVGGLVVGTESIPAVELYGLLGELYLALRRQPRHDRVDHRVGGGLCGSESVAAAEARCYLQRLAAGVAEAWERLQQELLVGDRLTDLQRCVP